MLKLKKSAYIAGTLLVTSFFLQACEDHAKDDKVVIQSAPKLSNDATSYAHAAWQLMNEVDPIVYHQQLNLIETQVRKPVRKLNTDWRIQVKMTDSVTEGKYALCRKALVSLEIWARQSLVKDADAHEKQADYERDKAQCKAAIDNPQLGNTDPKKNGV